MLWNKGFCVAPLWQYFHAGIRTLLYSTEINALYLSQNTCGTRWFTSVCWSTPTMLTLSSAVWSQMENWKWILCSASEHLDVHLVFGEAPRHVRTAERHKIFFSLQPLRSADVQTCTWGLYGFVFRDVCTLEKTAYVRTSTKVSHPELESHFLSIMWAEVTQGYRGHARGVLPSLGEWKLMTIHCLKNKLLLWNK